MCYKIIIRSFLLVAFIVIAGNSFSQQNEKEKVVEELKKVSARYKTSGSLSFEIAYKYATESNPGQYLDSLKGNFKISGDQYWYALDQTESVGNKDYMMMLFKEDKIIYLSKAASTMMSGNPVGLIDSFILRNTDIKCHLTEGKRQNHITLDFDTSAKYKKIEYTIDASTHYLTSIVCVVRSTELYDPSVKSAIDGGEQYAIINISFFDYRQQGFNNDLFDMSKYFKKDGDEFVTVPPYDSYKIFLGSPNL